MNVRAEQYPVVSRRRISPHLPLLLDERARHRLLRDAHLWNEIVCVETPTVRVMVADSHVHEVQEAVWTVQRSAISMMFPTDGYMHEAAFIDSGSEKLRRGGNLFFAPAGRALFRRSMPGRHRTVACSFDEAFCKRAVGSLEHLSSAQLAQCLDMPATPVLGPMMSRMMREAMQPGFISTALLESFAHAILQEWSCMVRIQPREERGRGRLTTRHFDIIEEYLATTSGSPSVSALAKACGFSERYFAHLFKKQTQQSIGTYLKHAQIAKSKALLMETDLPLKEIAYRVGFNTPSNFFVAFRGATGETPRQFREANRR